MVNTNDLFHGFCLKDIVSALTNKCWKLIILPTEKCNFRCTYCYEDYGLGLMSCEVVDAVKKLISNRINCGDLKRLHIAWFGGEPLLAKDIVYDINEYAMSLSNGNKKFNFTSDATTNGFLLDEFSTRKLLDLRLLQYQITLDGPKELHDKTRVKADGSGTFDTIWSNLLSMKNIAEEFTVLLRIHVHPGNVSGMKILMEKIRDNFSKDKRFRVFIRALSKLGGANENSVDMFSPEEEKNVIESLYEILGGDVVRWRLTGEDDLNYICYAAEPNSLVIRSDGSLAKCTVAFNDEHNKIGRLKEDGTLDIDAEKYQLWVNGFKNLDPNTLKCPYYQSVRKLCDSCY
ncbi:MAG: radical SAM protein [Gammaproteobacteria bacterium]